VTNIPERLPATHDTDAPPPVLLSYQRRWIEDDSQLKVSEKSRRTGLTWAEASDDVLIAAASKKAGGQNVYYIGYNQDMAIEFIEACAMWARAFSHATSNVEEGIWNDGEEDKHIKTFTIKFPDSGHRIVALSSRPANLRGKQGVVVIDEAAFHDKLGELLKAALALLIWGGKVRVISTHNGDKNPFNELINDIRAGKRAGSVQRITFQEAIKAGLYRRVCMRLGEPWTKEGQDKWTQKVYSFYGDAASEELDVVPSEGTGNWLPRALIEARMKPVPVLRLKKDDEFKHWHKSAREAEIRDWCEEHLKPLLVTLPENLWIALGEDFGRNVDLTVITPLVIGKDLVRRTPFIVELMNVPFEQQRQVLFYICDRFPRFQAAKLDSTGNGAYLGEVTAQQYGAHRVEEVKLSQTWYRENMPPLKAAFEDGMIEIARDSDHVDDLLAIKMIDGVASVPSNTRKNGRHGDFAVSLALAYAASRQDPAPIEYTSAPVKVSRWDAIGDDDSDLISDLPSMENGAW
jgi:phage FluMu gp28-like protein